MGTGSSRESGPTSQGSPRKKGKPFSDQTVEVLIREQKLAPRGVVEEADAVLQGVVVEEAQVADDKECPICFLNYQALNSVVCCKQSICTNCYVELRNTQPVAKNCHCPFCHQLGFVTTYSATPKFDYSNDRQFEGSAKKEAAAPTSSQRRGSGGGFPHPSAIAEKAAEKLTSAFESMRASVNGGSGSSKASSSQTLGAHHFLQQDSWDSPMRNLHADHSSQNEGTNPRTPTATATAGTATGSASGANGEGSKVNRRASDPNTPSRSTPTSVPLASKSDRASLEAQIRSQHADFDAEREYRRQSSSGGRQRAESEQLASHQRARSTGGGSPRTRTGSPRSPRSEIEGLGRLLAGLGARSPSGQPVMASYEDVARMEELMLQAALRESAQMAEAAPAPSSSDSGSSANSTTGSGAAVTDAADIPPPVPPSSTSSTSAGTCSGAAFSGAAAASEGRASNIAQRTATEVAVEMAVERENGGGRTESQASEDAELELALALSLEESHATVDSSRDSES